MANIIGQVKIDFEVIPTYEVYTLIIADSSEWKYLVNNEAVIGITLPNSKKEILHAFKKKSLNVFNSNNLGLTCVKECSEQEYTPIPDGLYTITLYSSSEYEKKEKWYFKTDNLQLELDKIFIKLGFEYKEDDNYFREELQKADFFLKAVHSAIRLGDQIKAQRYFEVALKLVDNFKNCKGCL